MNTENLIDLNLIRNRVTIRSKGVVNTSKYNKKQRRQDFIYPVWVGGVRVMRDHRNTRQAWEFETLRDYRVKPSKRSGNYAGTHATHCTCHICVTDEQWERRTRSVA